MDRGRGSEEEEEKKGDDVRRGGVYKARTHIP
jgi:hypothetical protein